MLQFSCSQYSINNINEKEIIMKIALIVGHKHNSPGANNNVYKAQEFSVNNNIVKNLVANLNGGLIQNVDEVIAIYRQTTFKDLPIQVNKLNKYL